MNPSNQKTKQREGSWMDYEAGFVVVVALVHLTALAIVWRVYLG